MSVPTRPLLIVLVVAAGMALAADDKILVDGVAAYVNEHVVTIGDVQALLEPVRRQLAAKYSGEELVARLREAFNDCLATVIDRCLILDEYSKLDRKLPQWFIDERIQAIIKDQFGGDRARLLEQLSRENMSWEEWQKEVADHVAVSYMRQWRVDEQVGVSPAAVRAAYESNRAEYAQPEKIKLRLIMLNKTGDPGRRALADEISARVVKGEDFAALAVRYSEDSCASKGGDWDWVEPRILRSDLADACRKLDAGGVSGVIETSDAYYLLKVEGKREASTKPFSEVQGDIERRLRYEEGARLLKAWTGRLRDSGYVKILPIKTEPEVSDTDAAP